MMHGHACKQFSGPITSVFSAMGSGPITSVFSAMGFDENPFRCQMSDLCVVFN